MANKDFVKVKVLDLPGVQWRLRLQQPDTDPGDMPPCCSKRWPSSGRAWKKAIPARPGLNMWTCVKIPRKERANWGNCWSTKKYPSPLVVIDGEPKFAGSIQVKKIVKEVGAILG